MKTFFRQMPVCAAALALSAAFAGPALGEDFCVNSASALKAAMDIAESNGEDDRIRLVSTTFASSPPFSFVSSEPHAITFVGGYAPGCLFVSGGETKIDGQFQRRGLFVLNVDGDVAVESISFIRGLSTNNRGGGLYAESETGDVRVDRNKFYANRADDMAGAAKIATNSGTLLVRGNLAFANSAANIGAFQLSQVVGTAYVVGNTITQNQSEGDFLPGGLAVTGSAHFEITNNIIWGNLPEEPGPTQGDFFSSTSHDVVANDIGVFCSQGTLPDEYIGNVSADPQFVDCGTFCASFELERNSPLVDLGENFPPGGITGLDLAGKPRLIGGIVDLGAFENDVIFEDAFE